MSKAKRPRNADASRGRCQLTNSPTHQLTALIRRRAPSGAGVHPVLLDEIVLPVGEPHVVLAVVRRLRRAPDPGALVGVLVATVVVPGIAARVGRRLLDL